MSKPSRKNRSKKTDQVYEESLTIKDGVEELEQEGDGDYVTKQYVCEMMKMQESLFRNLFDSLLTNVNSRIDGVIKDLAELKSSLQFTQKDVEDLKPVTNQMTKIGKELGEVGSFENEALENKDRTTRHPNLENEAPTTRKRRPLNLENEAPKTRNHCRFNNYNFTSCITQSESGGGSGCVRTSKGPQYPSQGFIKACQLFN